MIKIKSLIISNIGRFVGDHFIDIDSLDDLFQVDAKNENTGGSSGTGKTTIFNAIDYLFGVNDVPTTVLQSRLTKNPMSVTGSLEKNNEIYTIKRSKSGGLSIQTPSGEISGSSKVAEEWLDSFMEISRDLLRPIYHKRQKEGGFFLNKTPKEMYSFLATCQDLGSYIKKQEKAELKAKELEPKVLIFKEKIKTLESTLLTLSETKANLSEPKLEVDSGIVKKIEADLEAAKNSLKILMNDLDIKLQIPAPLRKERPEKPVRISELSALIENEKAQKISNTLPVQNIINSINKETRITQDLIQSLKIKASSVPSLDEKLSLLKGQIEQIKKSKCPTCDQDWSSDHSHGKYSDMVSKAKEVFSQRQSAVAASELIPSHEAELLGFRAKLLESEAELKELLSSNKETSYYEEKNKLEKEFNDTIQDESNSYILKLKQHTDKLASIKLEAKNDIDQAEGQLRMQQDLYRNVSSKIELYEKEKTTYLKNIQNILAQETKISEDILTSKNESLATNKEFQLAESSSRLIKSYVNQLFYDTLAQIAKKATETLLQIPNMETACLTFEVFKETKSGSVKEEVSAILSIDNEESVPVKSLSGGERTTIDLAVDLAVIDMIEERTGNGLNIFILDEPFDGLDSVNKERCLAVLINHGTTKKIGIVDHSNETKELVSSRITVVRSGQESSIQ